ncbi:MAG: hypothetical protein QOF73_3233 [Thermomicrobiales bacterium]|jgi:hypothetical protein|nr:hypothetical protein [Thermomicrobiales bacterium]
MGLQIEHRTEQGVMVLRTPFSMEALASRVVGTGEELVVINERTGDTLIRFTVSMPDLGATPISPDPSDQEARSAAPPSSPVDALARHGLDGDWETLMTEVEHRGWYVIPTAAPTASGQASDDLRHVVLGIGSRDAHVTVEGWGRTVVEALGWAMVRALDAIATPVAA